MTTPPSQPSWQPPAQLALSFPRVLGYGLHDLLPNTAQHDAQAWLHGNQRWPLQRLALWGEAGSGKTHLAHAWAEQLGGIVLPHAPDAGQGNDWPQQPVAIDSVDHVPDEPALLHLINAAAETRQPLLLVSRVAPGRLGVRLPDLASRLRATTAVSIGPADDAFLPMLLTRLLADRQLRVAGGLQSWLLTRLPRSPAAVRDAVTRLEAASLSTGRLITRRLATEVLGFCDNSDAQGGVASPSATELD